MPQKFTRTDAIAALRDVASRIDRPLSSEHYPRLRKPGQPSVATVINLFGSWPAALEAAGLTGFHRRPVRHWTGEQVAAAVAAWLAGTEDHRIRSYEAAAREDWSLPPMDAIRRWFGGWKGAMAAAREHANSHG